MASMISKKHNPVKEVVKPKVTTSVKKVKSAPKETKED